MTFSCLLLVGVFAWELFSYGATPYPEVNTEGELLELLGASHQVLTNSLLWRLHPVPYLAYQTNSPRKHQWYFWRKSCANPSALTLPIPSYNAPKHVQNLSTTQFSVPAGGGSGSQGHVSNGSAWRWEQPSMSFLFLFTCIFIDMVLLFIKSSLALHFTDGWAANDVACAKFFYYWGDEDGRRKSRETEESRTEVVESDLSLPCFYSF